MAFEKNVQLFIVRYLVQFGVSKKRTSTVWRSKKTYNCERFRDVTKKSRNGTVFRPKCAFLREISCRNRQVVVNVVAELATELSDGGRAVQRARCECSCLV